MLVSIAVVLVATLDICMAHKPSSSKLLRRVSIIPDGDIEQYKDDKSSAK